MQISCNTLVKIYWLPISINLPYQWPISLLFRLSVHLWKVWFCSYIHNNISVSINFMTAIIYIIGWEHMAELPTTTTSTTLWLVDILQVVILVSVTLLAQQHLPYGTMLQPSQQHIQPQDMPQHQPLQPQQISMFQVLIH